MRPFIRRRAKNDTPEVLRLLLAQQIRIGAVKRVVREIVVEFAK
jgi:hypothetical protein